jgi:hypothetical protein
MCVAPCEMMHDALNQCCLVLDLILARVPINVIFMTVTLAIFFIIENSFLFFYNYYQIGFKLVAITGGNVFFYHVLHCESNTMQWGIA